MEKEVKGIMAYPPQFEFENKELEEYKLKIWEDSKMLIEKIVKEYSPIQKDEIIDWVKYNGNVEKLKVARVILMAVDSWGCLGGRLSFAYWGMPLTKKGKVAKNRKQIYFYSFYKNGKKYHMPSYNRLEVKTARMFKG